MLSLYFFIRYILLFVIFIVICKILEIKGIEKKNNFILLICIIGWVLSVFVNIESVCLNFKSPETAYSYVEGNKKISLIINGNETTLVVPKNGEEEILLKDGNNWKIRYNFYSKIIPKIKEYGLINISVYNYKKDFYIKISSNSNYEIKDNRNTDFVLKKQSNNQYIYYGYINNYNDDYEITINNEKYKII